MNILENLNYASLINNNERNIVINKRKLDYSKYYTLHINSLSNLKSFKLLETLIKNINDGTLLCKDHIFLLIIDQTNKDINFQKRYKKIQNSIKGNQNIILLRHQSFGFFGKYPYYDLFHIADNFLATDENIFYYEYILLLSTFNTNVVLSENLKLDFYSLDKEKINIFHKYDDLKQKIRNQKYLKKLTTKNHIIIKNIP